MPDLNSDTWEAGAPPHFVWTRSRRPRGRSSRGALIHLAATPFPLTASLPCSEHDLGEDIYDCVPCEDEGDDIYEDIIKVEVQQPMVSRRPRPPAPLPQTLRFGRAAWPFL